jgi:arylsulfatase A-like enzyme
VEGRDLVLPPGTSATYYLAMPAAARLVYERVASGAAPPRITVQADGRRERDITSPGAGAGTIEADLAPEAGTPARLTIANPTDAADVRLRQPRITTLRAPHRTTAAPRRPSGSSVVLYLVDTLRADRLGCYGYRRPTSPHLDAFAREAVLFEHVVAQSSWTRPAAASILTGRYPEEHGATSLMDGIRPDVPTAAELLKRAGYVTAAFVTNLNVAGRFGFGRGFDEYHYFEERDDRDTLYLSAAELNAAVLPWLDAHHDRPFFLYVHATDPHAPYRPSADEAARFVPATIHPTIGRDAPVRELLQAPELVTPDNLTLVSGLYDAEVATADAGFGALRAKLTALGLDGSTVIVFVADHGEEFHEHGGFDHGRTLYEEVVHVPLVVRLPGAAGGGRRVTTLARQVDLLPTLLALLGLDAPGDLPGVALLDPDGTSRDAATETHMATELTGRPIVGFSDGTWKAVWPAFGGADEALELYDLRTDVSEQHNVRQDHPVVAGSAVQSLERARLRARHTEPADTTVVDPAIERRLRALGYVTDTE